METKRPKSLVMIQKEAVQDLNTLPELMAMGSEDDELPPDTTYLDHLPKEGVLLLNTALSVEHNKAGSHAELWKPFTEEVIKTLQEQDNIVWILWGNHAKAFKELITNPTHKIVEGVHPVARGKHAKFLGGKYFSKTNEHLKSMGHQPINW